MSLRIVISAGEVSGDRHLSKVVRALKSAYPGCEIRGLAGPESQEAGAELLLDCYRSGATMGFGQVLRSASKIFASFRTMKNLIRQWKPDLVILVDYPDFNMRLAKVAHKAGCKVLYYIPPKVWAWRSGRVEKIKRYVDHVAAIFPFEKAFYEKRGYLNVTYVGHPLGASIGGEATERSNTLLMLPGSRNFEVDKILPPMVRVFERLKQKRRDLTARVLVAPNMSVDSLRQAVSKLVSSDTSSAISWIQGDSLEEMKGARAGILKSGTCNLEGAVAGLPFVSVYSGSYLSKVIVSALVPLVEFSPVNIMRPGTIKEVFAVTIDEDLLEQEVAKILDEGAERAKVMAALAQVQGDLQGFDAVTGAEAAHGVPDRVAHLAQALARGEIKPKGGTE